MKKIKMKGEFKSALPVLEKIKKAGYEAYFVGGSVRDSILGLEVNDVDVATNAFPNEVKGIFDKTVDVGIEHGTVLVLYQGSSYEVTTYRTESSYQDYRRPDSVTFVRSLKEDLKRRDFTINAFAADETGKIEDYFDGTDDLNDGLVRAVGIADERFNEDALRMLRGVRFASQLDFEMEEKTSLAIQKYASLLEKIAVERIQVEFIKLLCGKAKDKGIKLLIETGLFRYCPELKNKKSALIHLSSVQEKIHNERQAWAVLIYYIMLAHPFPDQFSIKDFLKQWKVSNKMIQMVQQLLKGIEHRLEEKEVNPWVIYQLGEELALEVEVLLDYIDGHGDPEGMYEVYSHLPIYSRNELAVSGNDFVHLTSTRPGKWLGNALDEVLKAVVLKELPNDKTTIIKWVKSQNLIPLDEE